MYDHYIALDWARSNMALARLTKNSKKVHTKQGPSDLFSLKQYLKSLKGKSLFTIEETTSSQWLYSELRPYVTKLLVCDPYHNRLLSEGSKTDKIDAIKLVHLQKAGLLKEVYHSGEDFIYLRKLSSGYNDVVKSGVRLKNQKSCFYDSVGLDHKKDEFSSGNNSDKFVLERIDKQIELKEQIKKQYVAEFKRLSKKHKELRLLKSVPGISDIQAVQIVFGVINIKRFKNKGHFLSYCGLVDHNKISGGRSYGRRKGRCYRPLRQVFRLASHVVTQERCNNPLRDYYEYLLREKNKAPRTAKQAVARRLAVLVYGILKTGEKFDPHRREKEVKKKKSD